MRQFEWSARAEHYKINSQLKGAYSHSDPVLRGAVYVTRRDLGEHCRAEGGSELHHGLGKTRGKPLRYKVLIELCREGHQTSRKDNIGKGSSTYNTTYYTNACNAPALFS